MDSSHPPKPKSKSKKPYPRHQHHPPKKSSSSSASAHSAPRTITAGDSGIWATCTKGKEGKATVDLLDLFARYAESLYGIHDNVAPVISSSRTNTGTAKEEEEGEEEEEEDEASAKKDNDDDVTGTGVPTSSTTSPADANAMQDIETSIANEIHLLRTLRPHPHPPNTHPSLPPTPKPTPLILPIRLTTPCLLFFRTAPPLDPVTFTTAICRAAATTSPSTLTPSTPSHTPTNFTNHTNHKLTSHHIKRLTPTTLIGKATLSSLSSTAMTVLAAAGMSTPLPASPAPATPSESTFAIHPSIREHTVLRRSAVIECVAALVGGGWKVDLGRGGAEKVILVEVWRNVCGVAVVEGREWERLKRFNLAELGGRQEGEEGGVGAGVGVGNIIPRGDGEGSVAVDGGGGGGGEGAEEGEMVNGTARGGGGGGGEMGVSTEKCDGVKRKRDGIDGEEERLAKLGRGEK